MISIRIRDFVLILDWLADSRLRIIRVWIILFVYIYILLISERFLGHYHGGSRWSTSGEEDSEEKWTSVECRSGYRGNCG